MEEEEKEAQHAKLQELIRRGGPEDLQEANRLMKIMAGYDTRSKTDYRAKAAEEVGKVQQKARLLEERLEAFTPGDKMVEGDVFEELASALQSAQPKIQKMCEEESDDHEAVAKLLEINDSIHRTVERYKLMKKGDVEAAQKIAKGTLGTSTGVGKNAANELSLIDFDAEEENGEGSSQAAVPSASIEDDLLGLTISPPSASYGQAGALALGFGANTNIPGGPLLSSTTQNNSARIPTPLSTTPQPPSSTPKPNYEPFGAFAPSASPALVQAVPQPSYHQKPVAAAPPQASDPFAAIASIVRKDAQPSSPVVASSNSLVDFSSFSNSSTPKPAAPPAPASADDEEWAFESALPESNGLPTVNNLLLTQNNVIVSVEASRKSSSDPLITLSLRYSNGTPRPVEGLTFQAAVSKV
jgi:hypothetical protein